MCVTIEYTLVYVVKPSCTVGTNLDGAITVPSSSYSRYLMLMWALTCTYVYTHLFAFSFLFPFLVFFLLLLIFLLALFPLLPFFTLLLYKSNALHILALSSGYRFIFCSLKRKINTVTCSVSNLSKLSINAVPNLHT